MSKQFADICCGERQYMKFMKMIASQKLAKFHKEDIILLTLSPVTPKHGIRLTDAKFSKVSKIKSLMCANIKSLMCANIRSLTVLYIFCNT